MQVLHAANPAGHFTWLLVCLVDRINAHRGCARNILALHVLELQYSFVLVVEARLIEYANTQVLFLSIWLRHLKEGVDLSDSGDVVWDEWLELGFEVDLLGFVTLNVLEHFLELL